MYIDLIKKLNNLFNTEVVIKINKTKYIPTGNNIDTYKEYISIGFDKGIYIKDKILENREKVLLKFLLEQYLETNNILLDVILNKDAYKNIDFTINYPFYLWEVIADNNSEDILKIIHSIFPNSISFIKDKNSVIIFKQTSLEDENSLEDIYCDLESEILSEISIYISYEITKVNDIYDAYSNLLPLKEFSKIIHSKNNIYEFNKLLLANIFLNIKKEKNLNYLENIFQKNNRYKLDKELLNSALIFFENNLNISEAAIKLYIHRNTLVYRLKKIKSITGYDIRKFNDAVNFYLNYLYDNLIGK